MDLFLLLLGQRNASMPSMISLDKVFFFFHFTRQAACMTYQWFDFCRACAGVLVCVVAASQKSRAVHLTANCFTPRH